MFKYKKIFLFFLTIMYTILTVIEIIKYMFINSNLYGLVYLMVTLLTLFLLVPTVYNYDNKFSKARISKILIVIILGFFSSFFLDKLVINQMHYTDSSYLFLSSTVIIRKVLKVIIYFLLLVFLFFEAKVIKIINKLLKK